MNSEPVLRALLEEVGLDPEKALASLQNKKAIQHFEDGIREALRKGEMQEEGGKNISQFVTLVRFGSLILKMFNSAFFFMGGDVPHLEVIHLMSKCIHLIPTLPYTPIDTSKLGQGLYFVSFLKHCYLYFTRYHLCSPL